MVFRSAIVQVLDLWKRSIVPFLELRFRACGKGQRMPESRLTVATLLTGVLWVLMWSRRRQIRRQVVACILAGATRDLDGLLAGQPGGPSGTLPDGGRISSAAWRSAAAGIPRIVNPPMPDRPSLQALALLAGDRGCLFALARRGWRLDPEGDHCVLRAAFHLHGPDELRALARASCGVAP
ncbi:hypothetical protein [Azospirillum baldaniorum]|uniref:hypothetical protein n=1 Tax=Azospirillum baldaniorum TaxID=1064539 RepID=UPI001013D2D5|nr:hypothetical protein [Azospirillum baldaniorum]